MMPIGNNTVTGIKFHGGPPSVGEWLITTGRYKALSSRAHDKLVYGAVDDVSHVTQIAQNKPK